MTKDEQIMRAVAVVILRGKTTFTRNDIHRTLGVGKVAWDNEYSPRFQGMRVDEPGGAPNVGGKWKDVFQRIERGQYQLTPYGLKLLCDLVGPRL